VSEVTKLIDERQIEHRVHELAADIARTMPTEFTVVALLKGSFIFAADLVRALDGVGLAPRVEFLRLSSYGCGRESSGQVRLIGEVPEVEGRSVLLVDDITDSGWSLVHALKLLRERGALETRTCTLIDKPTRRRVDFSPDFIGFEVGDVFVVGYGIDFAEAHRHLPYIGRIE
jgi:hypoxanthine phosphoribosyltransferase